MDSARVTVDERAGVAVARIDGEFDKLAVDAIGPRLLGLRQEGPLIVDLDGVTFIDSAALHILFGLARSVGGQNGFAVVIADESPIRRVLELAQLGVVTPVRDSVEAATRDVS